MTLRFLSLTAIFLCCSHASAADKSAIAADTYFDQVDGIKQELLNSLADSSKSHAKAEAIKIASQKTSVKSFFAGINLLLEKASVGKLNHQALCSLYANLGYIYLKSSEYNSYCPQSWSTTTFLDDDQIFGIDPSKQKKMIEQFTKNTKRSILWILRNQQAILDWSDGYRTTSIDEERVLNQIDEAKYPIHSPVLFFTGPALTNEKKQYLITQDIGYDLILRPPTPPNATIASLKNEYGAVAREELPMEINGFNTSQLLSTLREWFAGNLAPYDEFYLNGETYYSLPIINYILLQIPRTLHNVLLDHWQSFPIEKRTLQALKALQSETGLKLRDIAVATSTNIYVNPKYAALYLAKDNSGLVSDIDITIAENNLDFMKMLAGEIFESRTSIRTKQALDLYLSSYCIRTIESGFRLSELISHSDGY